MAGYWNYRVIEFFDINLDEPWRGIFEVHYDENRNPVSYTEEPCAVTGANNGELSLILEGMAQALDKPTLVEKDFVKADHD